MKIPDCVKNAVTADICDNNFFYGADEMWERLTEVYCGKVSYKNIDMSMLANCMELYYKGFLKASGVSVSAVIMEETHSLLKLHDEISARICPLQYFETKSEEREFRTFLCEFGAKYIGCRYHHEQVPREEFSYCYDWVEKQKNTIFQYLKPQKAEPVILDEDKHCR